MKDVYFYEGDFRFGDPENWEDAEVLTVDEMVDEANYGTKLEDQIEELKNIIRSIQSIMDVKTYDQLDFDIQKELDKYFVKEL